MNLSSMSTPALDDDKSNVQHQDNILDGVVEQYDGTTVLNFHYTKEEEHKVIRKLDRLIMPAVCILYLFSSLDKGNIGNAKTLGMVGKEGFGPDPTGKRYALLNAFYFIGYATWMIPTTLFAKKTKVHWVIGMSGVLWGIAAASTAAARTWGQGSACRYFVGFGESGFGPVIPFYLARWYTRRELALRMAVFLCSGPLAGIINGLVAYGVSFSKHSLEPWRLLFVIEGCPAVVAGFFALAVLPGDPATARWLSQEERQLGQSVWYTLYTTKHPAVARKAHEAGVETGRIDWKQAFNVCLSWQIILPAMSYQVILLVGAALGAFLPTLVRDVGYTGAIAQVYTLPPYACAAICMLIAAYLSDKYRRRGIGMLVGMASMTFGFAMLTGFGPHQRSGRYAALVFADIGQFICIPLNLTWAAENAGSESRRAMAIPLVVTLGQGLAIASGYLFPARDSPRYFQGALACTLLTAYGFCVSLLYIILLRRENARRDRVEGRSDPSIVLHTAELADKAPGFRYSW